jgi:nucleoside-diphosphate-sugar epimerase
MTNRHYLVTGGSGFIGAALVRRLVCEGHRVRVLDNNSRGSTERLADVRHEIEFIQADIRDARAVSQATTGVDSVCHLAFVNGTQFFYDQPEFVLDVGVKGIVNVIDACLDHGVADLIVASSSEVYQTPPAVPTDETVPLSIPDPHNPRYSYAAGKILTEIMAINYGRKYFERVVIFRPHNVYGPDMGWEHVIPQFVLRMKSLCQDTSGPIQFPIQGTGQETRAFVFIDDFTDGLDLLLERGEHLGIYNIGTDEEVAIKTVARLVGEYFGREVEILPGELARGGTLRRCPDITKLAALGYRPQSSLREGVSITARWYDENAHRAPA